MEAKPDTIKVVALHREQIPAIRADLSVVFRSTAPEIGQLMDQLAHLGLPADAIRVEALPAQEPGQAGYRLGIRCEEPQQVAAVQTFLSAVANASLENIEWQYPEAAEAQVVEEAVKKADAQAGKIAASLGMRLQGVYKRSEKISEEDVPALTKTPTDPQAGTVSGPPSRSVAGGPSKLIEARVEIEYRVSGFSQARVDLMTLRSAPGHVPHLLRKELSTRWFRLAFGLKSRLARKSKGLTAAPASTRALVAGHFSIPGGGGTFGDLEAKEMVCRWLSEANIEFDVASNNEDGFDGLKLDLVDETHYGIFIFVCGPWYPQQSVPSMLLAKFGHCVKIGVNLTVFGPGNAGFDYLLSRDSPTEMRADIAFARQEELLPVVGVLLVERQKAYGIRQRHGYVKQIITEYIETGEAAPVWLDTNANHNLMGIKTSRQFESILRRTDVVITNRLHGLVLSLKNSVPVIAIDAVSGGGKVTAQAKSLGWPLLIEAEDLSVDKLRQSVRTCLDSRMVSEVQQAQRQAQASIANTKNQFIDILRKIRSS